MIDLINYALSKKGSASVDLSTYVSKSELNNYAKKNEIKAYMPFKSNWRITSTIANFCYDVDHDHDAVEGMTFLGELKCSDFYSGNNPAIINGEAVVEVIKENGVGGGKTIHIILTSGTTYPYRWEYTYFGGTSPKGWIGFYPTVDGKISALALTSDVQANLAQVEKNIVKIGTVTLDVEDWIGNGPYTQVVGISGVTTTSNSKVDLQLSSAQIEQLIEDGVIGLAINNNNNILTAYCFGAAPSVDMIVQCSVMEVLV